MRRSAKIRNGGKPRRPFTEMLEARQHVPDSTLPRLHIQDLDPSGNGIIYDRDAPTLHNNGNPPPAASALEIHHKFRQFVEFNGVKCSGDYFWRWSGVWIAGAEHYPAVDRTLAECAANWVLPLQPIHPLL